LATQFFSDEQMERLRSYPDIGREELIRFFTLARKDLGFVDNLGRGGGRGPAARLGLAVQLCTLPWLGFVPDDLWSVPQAAVLRLANQLAVFPGMLEQYGRRAQTRSDHLKLVLKYGLEAGAGRRGAVEGAGAVPAGPGDGARHPVPAVPPGGGVPGQRARDAARCGDADGDGRDRANGCGR
jgi:Domain of unknown function (DUF4158)